MPEGWFLGATMLRTSAITPLGTAADGAGSIRYVIERTLAGTTAAYVDQRQLARADPLAYDLAVRRQLHARAVARGAAPRGRPVARAVAVS